MRSMQTKVGVLLVGIIELLQRWSLVSLLDVFFLLSFCNRRYHALEGQTVMTS